MGIGLENTSETKIEAGWIGFEFKRDKREQRLSRWYDGCSEFQGIGPDSRKVLFPPAASKLEPQRGSWSQMLRNEKFLRTIGLATERDADPKRWNVSFVIVAIIAVYLKRERERKRKGGGRKFKYLLDSTSRTRREEEKKQFSAIWSEKNVALV